MRYLGNKTTVLPHIHRLLEEKGISEKKDYTFFDAFCGSGAVADSLKTKYNIIINDILKWSTVYSEGKLCNDILSNDMPI